ncbi:hypothetical protein SDC9_108319 [bioreactor metagenome]|uniref:Uncharacterized protein n=1 Tax=bioreactor metagenome TaxID=1076179 RepID=A0A645B7K8_9ZZZZ
MRVDAVAVRVDVAINSYVSAAYNAYAHPACRSDRTVHCDGDGVACNINSVISRQIAFNIGSGTVFQNQTGARVDRGGDTAVDCDKASGAVGVHAEVDVCNA